MSYTNSQHHRKWTEEDTFKILSRPSHHEILDKFNKLPIYEQTSILFNKQIREHWLRKYGWTFDEYYAATMNKNE